jgi:ABC-type Fe3+-hydroxamate transport system substrate-binding protein
LRHKPDYIKINDSCAQDDENKLRGAPGVEENTATQNYSILISLIGQEINQEKQGQKIENKYNAAENHTAKIEMFGKMQKKYFFG